MKTFHYDSCGALVFFENVSCLQCGHAPGFLPGIMDPTALETATGFGIPVRPRHPAVRTITSEPRKVLTGGDTFDNMVEHWFPLTYALNSLNRGVGVPDLYPFILSSPALEKLHLVHDVISRQESQTETSPDAVSCETRQEVN